MRPTTLTHLRRYATTAAFAAAVSAATVEGVALAGPGAVATPLVSGSGAAGPSKGTPIGTATRISRDPVAAAARIALNRLAAAGTISQAQADRIERYVIAGSIDPAALVNDGLVTDAQMQAVGATLDQVKRSVG